MPLLFSPVTFPIFHGLEPHCPSLNDSDTVSSWPHQVLSICHVFWGKYSHSSLGSLHLTQLTYTFRSQQEWLQEPFPNLICSYHPLVFLYNPNNNFLLFISYVSIWLMSSVLDYNLCDGQGSCLLITIFQNLGPDWHTVGTQKCLNR